MKNSFVNLALPLFLFSEPLPPIVNKDGFDISLQENVKAIPPS